jgi:DNA-binding HxlR family transcriptional regulator
MKLQNQAEVRSSVHGKWYDDACGTAFGMELVGERWSLLVVRELMLGPLRFSALRANLPGISAKVLTERLETLEASNVLAKRLLPPPASAQVYELTQWGYAAEPLIQELGRWAAQNSQHDPTLPLSAASLMLSMRTMVDRSALSQFQGRVGFVIAGDSFVATPAPTELPIERGEVIGADAVFRAPVAAAVAAGIYAGVPWPELEHDAGVSIEGDRDLAMRYVALFSLPPPMV